MSIKLIESNDKFPTDKIIKLLKDANLCNDIEYYVMPELPEVINVDIGIQGITLSLDCRDLDNCEISMNSRLDDCANPKEFFNKIAKLDNLCSTLQHILQDFSSIIREYNYSGVIEL